MIKVSIIKESERRIADGSGKIPLSSRIPEIGRFTDPVVQPSIRIVGMG